MIEGCGCHQKLQNCFLFSGHAEKKYDLDLTSDFLGSKSIICDKLRFDGVDFHKNLSEAWCNNVLEVCKKSFWGNENFWRNHNFSAMKSSYLSMP